MDWIRGTSAEYQPVRLTIGRASGEFRSLIIKHGVIDMPRNSISEPRPTRRSGDIASRSVPRVCPDFLWLNVFCMYRRRFDYEFPFRLPVFFNDWRSRNPKSPCIISILLIKSLFVLRLCDIYTLLHLISNKRLWDLKTIEGKRGFSGKVIMFYVNIYKCIRSVHV